MKRFYFLFILLNLIISIFYIDLWNNANTTSRILPIISYFESGTFQIDKYHELTCDKSIIKNHYYSEKAPLPTIIVFPFFGLLKLIGLIKSHNGSLYGRHVYAIGSFLCSMIPFVLILFLTFKKIYKNSSYSPVLLTMLPFYGSFIFIFSGTFFNHLSSSIFLLFSYILLKEKKYWIAGVFAGLAFLCEFIIALVIFIWVFQILWNERNIKSVCKFILGVFPFVVFIMIYNYIFTNSPFTMIYKFHNLSPELHVNYAFVHPTAESLWGLIFSDYRGLFFYAPFLLIILFYFIKRVRMFPIKKIVLEFCSNYLFLISFTIIIATSSYLGWWGGWSYGPRLLIFITVLLFYEGIIFLSKQNFSKIFFWIVITFGITIAFMAKSAVLYCLPTEIKHPLFQIIIPDFISCKFNSNNLLTLFLGVNPVVSFLVWLVLFISSLLFLTIYFKKNHIKTS